MTVAVKQAVHAQEALAGAASNQARKGATEADKLTTRADKVIHRWLNPSTKGQMKVAGDNNTRPTR